MALNGLGGHSDTYKKSKTNLKSLETYKRC